MTRGNWIDGLPGPAQINVDILAVLIACLFLYYGFTATLIFAFAQGFLVDLFSCGFEGLFALLYLGVFFGVHLGSRFFNLQDWKGQAFLVASVVLVKMLLFLPVMSISLPDLSWSTHLMWTIPASAFCTGLVTPLFFHLSYRLWALLSVKTDEASVNRSVSRGVGNFILEKSDHRKQI